MPDGSVGAQHKRPAWARPLPKNSTKLGDRFWKRHPEIERAPDERAGRFQNEQGRREPVCLVPHPPQTGEYEPLEPFEPSESWADTIGRALSEKPPLVPPPMPPWAEALGLRVVNGLRALLTVREIPLATAEKSAVGVRRLAEGLASSFTNDDERKKRQVSNERAEALLRALLQLADEIQGIRRTDEDRFYARHETVKVSPWSKRRTELLKIYAELLAPVRLTCEQRIRLDVAWIFAEASRWRAQPTPRHQWWWQPPGISAAKNKTTSRTCDETPGATCVYIDRGPAIVGDAPPLLT